MAYEDALFQLGMDLTRSSTAQKEDHGETARVAHNLEPASGRRTDRSEHLIEREGASTAGSHLIVDLYGAGKLDDLRHIEHTLKRCVEVADATLLHVHLQRFTPNGGVSGVAVVSGGHLSIYSWPERGYAALDVFMPGDGKASLCVGVLMDAFGADKVVVKSSRRGEDFAESDVAVMADEAPRRIAATRGQRARVKDRKAA